MQVNFYKYEGAGNDFIILDNRDQTFSLNNQIEVIKKLCNRHFGIGADGLMILQDKVGYDFEMLYFNADGKEGSMCGNGGRCIVAFAKYLGIIQDKANFLAVDGSHYAKISEEGNWVSLQMIDVQSIKPDGDAYILNTGSPHYVLQVENLDKMDVVHNGKNIRYNDSYSAEGINVNFVEDMGEYLYVRTYERGVEDETFACGTGVTAVAITMAKKKGQIGNTHTHIKVPGGDLSVAFNYNGNHFSEIFLQGPATFVFQGLIKV